VENKKTPNFMGYSPVLSGNNDPNGAGDLQEGFEFKFEALNSDESESGADNGTSTDTVLAGTNPWPVQLPEFRQAALEY
jgi:isopenicillin N synthase-like dioxygenase